MRKKPNVLLGTDNLPEQCIICGTIIGDLDEDDIVEIQFGKLCYGCFNEGWFKKCGIYGKYEFEAGAKYDDEKEYYICKSCQSTEEVK